MQRKTRYPQSRPASSLVVALLAALMGLGVPATVTGLFGASSPHVDAPASAQSGAGTTAA